MKYKYFLRGFGFGILFATLIIMFAFTIKENMPQNNSTGKDVLSSDAKENDDKSNKENNKKDDDDIKESEKTSKDENEDEIKDKDNNVEDVSNNDNETSTKDNNEMSSEESSDDSEEKTSEDSSTSKVEEETTDKEIEETTSKEEESTSEIDTDNSEEQTSTEMVAFTLSGGMSSNQVAQALKDLGVVDNADEFNKYMEKNGTSKKLRIGVYQIPKNASFGEITDILMKKN